MRSNSTTKFAAKKPATGPDNGKFLNLPEVTDATRAFVCPTCGSLRTVDVGRYYRRKGPQVRYRECKGCKGRYKVLLTGAERMGTHPRRKRPMILTEKKCPKCALMLPIERFHKSGVKYTSWCRECVNAGCATRGFNRTLQEFGLTPDAYRAAIEAQGHRCPICRRHEADGLGKWTEAKVEGRKNRRLQSRRFFVVDHDHETGRFRGLLCYQCNLAIGNFNDDPARMIAAIEYLKERP